MNAQTTVTVRQIVLPKMDPAQVKKEIEDFVLETVLKNHATGGVIGLSGGVDSTTTAALAKYAFDRYNDINNPNKKFELVGYILPSKTNSDEDTKDGISVAERLGIRYEVHSIESLLDAHHTTNPEAFKNIFDEGNMTSRIRSAVLNTKASTEHKTLLGTGNKDEDFGIGYYTLFGDGAVHCSPIAGLSKRLVRDMASHLEFSDLAYREPSAGLEPGQTDFKDLGYKYNLVELVTEGISQGFSREELYTHPQIVPVVANQQELYEKNYGPAKFSSARGVVDDILKRNESAKSKSKILHPPTPTITLVY